MRNKATGYGGEEAAALKLAEDGYEIIGRNVRIGHYEIDIIIRNEQRLAFVEVKTRKIYPSAFTAQRPADAVDAKKKERLTAAARQYLKTHQEQLGERRTGIDVTEVFLDPSGPDFRVLAIRHYENAVR